MDVDEVASELYGLPPAQFTAARNARSKEFTANGDRELAGLVRELPKPSVSAWALNGLSRAPGSPHGEFAEPGDALRAVQEHPDRATLTQLVGKRRSLVGSTVKAATQLATQHGVHLSPSALNELEHTLQAALADENAAAAAFSGTLIHGLTSDGVEPVDLSGAVAGVMAQSVHPRGARRAETEREHTSAKARNVAAAEAANAAAEAAEAALAVADKRVADLEEEGRKLEQEASELRERFRILEERQSDFDERESALQRERRTALEAAQRSRRAAKSATARLH